jgi:hypothetical protein
MARGIQADPTRVTSREPTVSVVAPKRSSQPSLGPAGREPGAAFTSNPLCAESNKLDALICDHRQLADEQQQA